MSGLTLVTYLGDNTTPIAAAIAATLAGRLGVPVAFDPDLPWPTRRAMLDAGEADIIWLCGLATAEALDAGRLEADIVAAPVFPGEAGPTYRSVIVARRDANARSLADLAGARLAVNERTSWSGYHALRAHLAAAGHMAAFFGSVMETGGHAASIESVLTGTADVAAIDDTVWAYRLRRDDRLSALAIVDRTQAWPAPPFSLARSIEPGLRDALATTLPGLAPVGLEGIVAATSGDYDPIRRAMALAAEVAW